MNEWRNKAILRLKKNKKVSYRKQIARQYSWSTRKNFPLVLFDHSAKFGCRFSYFVRAYIRSQKFRIRWCQALWDGGLLTPADTLLPHLCYCTKFDHYVKPFGRRVPKIWGTLGPAPWLGEWLTPADTLPHIPLMLPYQIWPLYVKPFGRR